MWRRGRSRKKDEYNNNGKKKEEKEKMEEHWQCRVGCCEVKGREMADSGWDVTSPDWSMYFLVVSGSKVKAGFPFLGVYLREQSWGLYIPRQAHYYRATVLAPVEKYLHLFNYTNFPSNIFHAKHRAQHSNMHEVSSRTSTYF